MSISLSRREVILTQLCTLQHAETDLVSQALRQIPRILEVLNLEPTTATEIYNFLLELQISRTEIALKTYIIYLSERKSSFRFFPVRGFWTQKINNNPHLILHLRGKFTEDDRESFTRHVDLNHSLEGPYTYILTELNIQEETFPDTVSEYIKKTFLNSEHDAIFQFLFSGNLES